MIKVYMHYNSLKSYMDGEWVVAKLQFVGQYDIEVLLDLRDIVISYQQNGFTIRKKKWYEKLIPIKYVK